MSETSVKAEPLEVVVGLELDLSPANPPIYPISCTLADLKGREVTWVKRTGEPINMRDCVEWYFVFADNTFCELEGMEDDGTPNFRPMIDPDLLAGFREKSRLDVLLVSEDLTASSVFCTVAVNRSMEEICNGHFQARYLDGESLTPWDVDDRLIFPDGSVGEVTEVIRKYNRPVIKLLEGDELARVLAQIDNDDLLSFREAMKEENKAK